MAKKKKPDPAPDPAQTRLVQIYALIGERQYLVAKLNAEMSAYLQEVEQIRQGK